MWDSGHMLSDLMFMLADNGVMLAPALKMSTMTIMCAMIAGVRALVRFCKSYGSASVGHSQGGGG